MAAAVDHNLNLILIRAEIIEIEVVRGECMILITTREIDGAEKMIAMVGIAMGIDLNIEVVMHNISLKSRIVTSSLMKGSGVGGSLCLNLHHIHVNGRCPLRGNNCNLIKAGLGVLGVLVRHFQRRLLERGETVDITRYITKMVLEVEIQRLVEV